MYLLDLKRILPPVGRYRYLLLADHVIFREAPKLQVAIDAVAEKVRKVSTARSDEISDKQCIVINHRGVHLTEVYRLIRRDRRDPGYTR